MGFAYRVVLVRMIGTEGVGLIEMVTPLFSFFLVLGGLGIQPALSQKVAQGSGQKAVYLRTAQVLMLLSGITLTVLGFLTTDFIIGYFVPDQRIYFCFRYVLPAIAVISIASAYRGWFQGMRQVSVIGGSQTVEQLVRVAVGIYLTGQFLNLGIEKAASAASIATVCGETAGYLYLLLRFKWEQRDPWAEEKPRFSVKAAKELLHYGATITAGRLVSSGIMMLQAFLIPLALQGAGWDTRAATEIYGRFSGVALSLLHLPGVFTTALAVSVLPAVAESVGNQTSGHSLLEKRINQSMAATTIFTLPGMAILFLLADQLCTWIFANPPAAPILKILAIGGLFFYWQLTLVSILQGISAVRQLLINNIISGVILLLGIGLLTPIPSMGILGTAMAVNLAWLCGMLLNLRQVYRLTRVRLAWLQILCKPLLALSCSLLFYLTTRSWLFVSVGSEKLIVCLQAGIFIGIYLLLLLLLGGTKLK